MKAPTEEQLRDPAWWDENAPKGATHAIPGPGDFIRWLMHDHGIWRFWEGGWWSQPSVKPVGKVLTRPTKPEPTKEERLAQHIAERDAFLAEDEAQPQAWDVIEAELHEGEGQWYEAVVIGKTLDGAKKVIEWVDTAMSKHSVDALPDSRIRPIRSQAERERDELAVTIWSATGYPKSHSYKIVDAIIAAGWRKGES